MKRTSVGAFLVCLLVGVFGSCGQEETTRDDAEDSARSQLKALLTVLPAIIPLSEGFLLQEGKPCGAYFQLERGSGEGTNFYSNHPRLSFHFFDSNKNGNIIRSAPLDKLKFTTVEMEGAPRVLWIKGVKPSEDRFLIMISKEDFKKAKGACPSYFRLMPMRPNFAQAVFHNRSGSFFVRAQS